MIQNLTPSKWALTVVCVIILLFAKFLPGIPGLPPLGSIVMYIFIGTVPLLLFVATTWPAILCIASLALNGVYSMNDAMAYSFGNWLFCFVMFAGMIVHILKEAGFLDRFALFLVSKKFVRKSPWLLLGSVYLSTCMVGSFMAIIPTQIVMTAIIERIFELAGIKKGERIGGILMLGMLFFCSVASGSTPFAHAPSVQAMSLFEGYVGTSMSVANYVLVGWPVAIITLVVYMLVLRFVLRLDISALSNVDPEELAKIVPPMSKLEKRAVIVFVCLILMWLLPDLLQNYIPLFAFFKKLGNLFPLLISVVVMCLVRADGKPIMDFVDTIKNGCPWQTMMLIAYVSILAKAMSSEDAGISNWISTLVGPMFSSMSPIMFMLLIGLFCVIVTNITSNTVTLALAGAIGAPLVLSGIVPGVNPAAMFVCCGFLVNCALALPSASSTAAIFMGNGWCQQKIQVVGGYIHAICLCMIVIFVGYPLGCFIMG